MRKKVERWGVVLLSPQVFMSLFSKNVGKYFYFLALGILAKLSLPEGNSNMMSYCLKYGNHNHQGSRDLDREDEES